MQKLEGMYEDSKFEGLSMEEMMELQGGDFGVGNLVENIKNYVLSLFGGNDSDKK